MDEEALKVGPLPELALRGDGLEDAGVGKALILF